MCGGAAKTSAVICGDTSLGKVASQPQGRTQSCPHLHRAVSLAVTNSVSSVVASPRLGVRVSP